MFYTIFALIRMGKKVTFSDNIQVKNISIDKFSHTQEIKNPKNFVKNPKKLENFSPSHSKDFDFEKKSNNRCFLTKSFRFFPKWLWILTFLLILIFVYYLLRKK